MIETYLHAHYVIDYLIDWTLLALVYIFIVRPWLLKKKQRKIMICGTILFVYICGVLMLTLMPFSLPVFGISSFHAPWSSLNLMPFIDVQMGRPAAWREIGLNILVMVPFGILYPLVRPRNCQQTIIVTMLFSLFIEIGQLLQAWWGNGIRIFDITDIITNTIGGAIGALLLFGLRHLLNKNN